MLGLAEKQQDRTWQYLLMKQIGDLPCLQTQLAPYKIARHGDPIKTYDHLANIVINYLDDLTMAKNRQATKRQLQSGQTKLLLSAAATTRSKSRRAKSKERKAAAAQAAQIAAAAAEATAAAFQAQNAPPSAAASPEKKQGRNRPTS